MRLDIWSITTPLLRLEHALNGLMHRSRLAVFVYHRFICTNTYLVQVIKQTIMVSEKIENVVYILTILIFPSLSQLIITGVGAMVNSRHFVEMYSTENIPDLSAYKITTGIITPLPKVGVPSDTFIILQGFKTNLSAVIACKYAHHYARSNPQIVKLRHGKDGVLISKGDTVIDTYGKRNSSTETMADACKLVCTFKRGWARRKNNKGPNSRFNVSDWVISRHAVMTNGTVLFPYPCMEYEAMNGKLQFYIDVNNP